MRHFKLGSKGDTIVEVLIAIVVVSSVLVGAFSISNLSLKQIRMAQERGEAQEIAKQATENLNSMVLKSISDGSSLLNRTTPFCKKTGSFDFVDANANDCKLGTEGRYEVAITKRPAPDDFGFQVGVNWTGYNGNPQEINIYYRAKTSD